MRRWFLTLAVCCVLTHPAQAQTLRYDGCDGARSCHVLTMQLLPFPPNTYPFAVWQVQFSGTFYDVGGYNDIGGHDNGAVWYPENPTGMYTTGDDVHHGPGPCNVQARVAFWFQYLCSGPTMGFDTQLRAAHGWQPDSIRVHLLYTDSFYDDTVRPAAVLRLSTVPEPAPVALVGAALVVVGAFVRRRRAQLR